MVVKMVIVIWFRRWV